MRVFIDIDGVMAELVEGIIEKYNPMKGTHLRKDNVYAYDLSMTFDQKAIEQIFAEPGFWRNLKKTPIADEILSAVGTFCKVTGADYAFLTSIYHRLAPTAAAEREEWIEEVLKCDPKHRLIVSNTKTMVARPGDILIEDSPNNIMNAHSHGVSVVKVEQPWNGSIGSAICPSIDYSSTADDILQILYSVRDKNLPVTIGNKVGITVRKKQEAYGDSFGRSYAVLEALFPTGIPVHAYKDALAITRIVDKLFRLASNAVANRADLMEESPGLDIAGYGVLIAANSESEE